ncbi:exo-alpha-sialidase [Marinilabiliaceae bacterium ANBcel2]|nr:exo-alpha-sialidase [Marinilabiliaceae bacterium ANBcel2]
MKKFLHLFLVLGLFCSLNAFSQTAPPISTEEDPVWFEIESACTDPITLNGLYTGPDDLRGYVLYDSNSGSRILARERAGGDEELWALVESDGVVRLMNKGTGRYMVESHSLNNSGENVTYGEIEGSDGQYWIRSESGTGSHIVIWNNLQADRLNILQADSNVAFYFIVRSDARSLLGSVLNSAQNLINNMVGEDPGFISPDSEAVDLFNSAITNASDIYDTGSTDEEFESASDDLNDAITAFNDSPKNPLQISDGDDETWYYIVSAAVNPYSSGKVIVNRSDEPGVRLQFDEKRKDPNMLWKIEELEENRYGLVNMASGLYIAVPVTDGTSETPGEYKIESLGDKGQFSIFSEGSSPLHCQENGSLIVSWPGGLDSPSSWRFETVSDDDAEAPLNFSSVEVLNGQVTTGIGNDNYASMYIEVVLEGFTGSFGLEEISLDFEGTSDIDDIEEASIAYVNSGLRYSTQESEILGSAEVTNKEVAITFDEPFEMNPGEARFALVLKISDSAAEGNLINSTLLSFKPVGEDVIDAGELSPEHKSTIFLTQSTLFSPGDYGSNFYRIPAIVTAPDGSLITATDKRNNHQGDLPADIDVYVRRSTDNGKTWSEPIMIAGENTTKGYGDPALVVEEETGKIFCVMAYDNGFFHSTPTDPIRVTISESSDNGLTWSDPKDITDSLYGAGSDDPISSQWNAMFVASGRGLQLDNGRLMFAVAVRGTTDGIDNYVIYSDDKGESWNINTEMVHRHGDEAKLAQRNNGDVIISIRNWGTREWNLSSDNGMTWGNSTNHPDLVDPNCNGEIMVYTSTNDNYESNRMLHSVAYAGNRSNVSMLLSYDEGETFPIVKSICPAPSAYSTFTKLSDGTIGVYYEDGSVGGGYDMVFVRFTLEWLTDGDDIYQAPAPTFISEVEDKSNSKVWSENSRIYVETSDDSDINIFSLTGVKVKPNTTLQSGIYIVRVGDEIHKVVVK